MDRIYTNHRHNERRIHIEIAENEVADLLDDLGQLNPDWFDATKKFRDLLIDTEAVFANDRHNDAHEADISRS